MWFEFLALAACASASTLTPPVLPLIVRNPYLSTWLGNARDAPWENWPIFWTGAHVGFSVMASVPSTGCVFPLLGRPQDSLAGTSANISYPEYLGSSFDASTTNLSYLIPSADDPVHVTLSFLSPITPSSTLRQSVPAAYLSVLVEGSRDITVYVDVNGEWVSGNRGNSIEWALSLPDVKAAPDGPTPIKTWKIARQAQELFTEFADHAEWGTLYFSGPGDVSYQAGSSAVLRQFFSQQGTLANELDVDFRGIMQEEPVFAFARSFKLQKGAAQTRTQDSAVFTFALVQDPVVQFAAAKGLTDMQPLWASYFDSADELVAYHYDDFENAAQLAGSYSAALAEDAYMSGSSEYQDIAALSARQVLGATQFAGTPDNTILFLKEISSNGNFQTVDVIFPAFPFFLYTNPRWLAYLLEPLLEHQLSGQYPNAYSMHDLGAHFPNATGHADGNDEYMPVEECGNMLIMGLALANALRYDTKPAFMVNAGPGVTTIPAAKKWSRAVDGQGMDLDDTVTGEMAARTWLSQSYRLWKQWTGYLVRESLIPANQLCTDDFAGWLANQTNLALKGIIGIRAMSEISAITGNAEDAKFYKDTAVEYMEKWQEYGISRDQTHAKLAYTWYGSWTTLYNLFADSLLCFHVAEEPPKVLRGSGLLEQKPLVEKPGVLIPDRVYRMQNDWYHAVLQRYGLPLDSRHLYTKSDWEFFAAAVTGRETRTEILTSIARWANETTTDRPLTDLYDTEGTGHFPDPTFMARPVVGGHFAFLALERACGGKAVEALRFLDGKPLEKIDVEAILRADAIEALEAKVPEAQALEAEQREKVLEL